MDLTAAMAADFSSGQQGYVPVTLEPMESIQKRMRRGIYGHLVMIPTTVAIGGNEMHWFVLNESAIWAAGRRLARNERHQELCGDRNGMDLAN